MTGTVQYQVGNSRTNFITVSFSLTENSKGSWDVAWENPNSRCKNVTKVQLSLKSLNSVLALALK